LFAYLNTGKDSLVLDLKSESDKARLQALVRSVDAVIDDHNEDWLAGLGLDPKTFDENFPTTVPCSITPFGIGAPKDWRNAKSHHVRNYRGGGCRAPSRPDKVKPPLKGAGRFLVDYETGLDAAMALCATLYWRGRTEQGQVIDLSEQDVMISREDTVLGRMITK